MSADEGTRHLDIQAAADRVVAGREVAAGAATGIADDMALVRRHVEYECSPDGVRILTTAPLYRAMVAVESYVERLAKDAQAADALRVLAEDEREKWRAEYERVVKERDEWQRDAVSYRRGVEELGARVASLTDAATALVKSAWQGGHYTGVSPAALHELRDLLATTSPEKS